MDLGDEGSLHGSLRGESHAGLMGRREGAKKGGEGGKGSKKRSGACV